MGVHSVLVRSIGQVYTCVKIKLLTSLKLLGLKTRERVASRAHHPLLSAMARESSPAEVEENEEDPNQRHDLVYDPDQDIQEKRQVRRGYRALLDETSGE